jgi:hypothetical protein
MRLSVLICVVLSLCANARAIGQRTWLNNVLEPTNQASAVYYKDAAGESGVHYLGRIHFLDGKLKAEGTYADAALLIPHGRFTFYHPDGKVESTGDYVMGNKSGVWQRFDRWGQALAEKVYDPQALESIEYTMARTMPQYPGGEQAMVRAVKAKVGKQPSGALASFVVEKDGHVTDVKVTGTDDRAAGEIAGMLSTSQWTAGHNNGLPVRVRMSVPLK